MTLHPHWGHGEVRVALARAFLKGSLPSALLIHGDKGVGKQHLALWLGRLLLCRHPDLEGPCETCQGCNLARRIEHPDLHWFFPLSRPKGSTSPQKLARALEDARAEALLLFRKNPIRAAAETEPRALYLAAAQTLRRQAQKGPSQGDRQVFLIADAESLAPQHSSSEAANALLKLLEEPPSGTTFVLTSSEPRRLLPTIRSRTTQLHLPPLSREAVTEFLVEVAGVPPDEAARVGTLSQGSIGRALAFLPEGEVPGPLEKSRADAFRLVSAAVAPGPESTFRVASEFGPVGARGLFPLLDSLQEWLRDLALAATGAWAGLRNREKEEFFRELLGRVPIHPTSVAKAAGRIDDARQLAAGNVNPQLVVFGLLHQLREELLAPEAEAEGGRYDG